MELWVHWIQNSDKNKILPAKEYLNKTRPYLKDIENNFKKPDTWKIWIKIASKFISSIDNEHVMLSKSDNIEIIMSDEPDEFITDFFDSLKNRYQNI